MSVIERTTQPITLARKARHRRPRLCTCCPRHIFIQVASGRAVRLLGIVALAADLYAAHKFGA